MQDEIFTIFLCSKSFPCPQFDPRKGSLLFVFFLPSPYLVLAKHFPTGLRHHPFLIPAPAHDKFCDLITVTLLMKVASLCLQNLP